MSRSKAKKAQRKACAQDPALPSDTCGLRLAQWRYLMRMFRADFASVSTSGQSVAAANGALAGHKSLDEYMNGPVRMYIRKFPAGEDIYAAQAKIAKFYKAASKILASIATEVKMQSTKTKVPRPKSPAQPMVKVECQSSTTEDFIALCSDGTGSGRDSYMPNACSGQKQIKSEEELSHGAIPGIQMKKLKLSKRRKAAVARGWKQKSRNTAGLNAARRTQQPPVVSKANEHYPGGEKIKEEIDDSHEGTANLLSDTPYIIKPNPVFPLRGQVCKSNETGGRMKQVEEGAQPVAVTPGSTATDFGVHPAPSRAQHVKTGAYKPAQNNLRRPSGLLVAKLPSRPLVMVPAAHPSARHAPSGPPKATLAEAHPAPALAPEPNRGLDPSAIPRPAIPPAVGSRINGPVFSRPAFQFATRIANPPPSLMPVYNFQYHYTNPTLTKFIQRLRFQHQLDYRHLVQSIQVLVGGCCFNIRVDEGQGMWDWDTMMHRVAAEGAAEIFVTMLPLLQL